MKMRGAACRSLLGLAVVIATASSAAPRRQTDDESLKSALEAVTRKQRSLDFMPQQDYYSEPRPFKYHPSDRQDEKFERERQPTQDLDDDDEDLEFLPLDNGQLENIGGGYQNFNSKRLERALIDYLENSPGQKESVPSPFRERERSGGHKRGINSNRGSSNDGDKELAALFYKELQNGPSYGAMGDVDSQDYLLSDSLQSYYDRYRAEQSKLDKNQFYDSSLGPMSWSEILGKQEAARNRNGQKNEEIINDEDDFVEHDQDPMYISSAERRNVNGRYPLGREYGVLLKRYPLTKRSPKPLQGERQQPQQAPGVITDPKVAKDLGALFGGQPAETRNNRTHDRHEKVQRAAIDKKDRHEATRNEHVHEHPNSEDNHDHERHATVGVHQGLEATSSEAPSSLSSPQTTPGQKEVSNGNTKSGKFLTKRDHRTIEVKKKSVDWSQYFGIDRRKKKAALLARPGSQDQDDEWMLQRYYKTMAENLKSSGKNAGPDKDNGEKRDKLDMLDTRLKNVKNRILQDASKYGSEDNSDAQEVKDIVMTRLAAAYSLEKMRRALDEFRSNMAAQRELVRAAHLKNNTTSNFRDELNGNGNGNQKKRSGNFIFDNGANSYEGIDEGRGCPELEAIERSCRPAKGLVSGLYEPCVMYKICRACDDKEECSSMFGMFAMEASKVCESISDSRESFGDCARTALVMWQMQPSPIASTLCHASVDSCLQRQYRYRHLALYYQNGWLPHVSADAAQLRER